MAPALIEVPQNSSVDKVVDKTADETWAKDKQTGNYKEAFAQSARTTNYEGELKGSDKHPPAAYPNCE